MKQTTFASMTHQAKNKHTRRARFLDEMERLVPWAELVAVIAPYYPTSGRQGREPKPLEAMLRIYLLQKWYAMPDPGMEDALYEIESGLPSPYPVLGSTGEVRNLRILLA